jgi:hypothetical protein
MRKLTDKDFEDLHNLTRSMLGGELGDYPNLVKIFKDEELIYSGDEKQPAVRFIPEARKILNINNMWYTAWREKKGL